MTGISKKYIVKLNCFAILFTLLFFSCSDNESEVKPDYSLFLSIKNPTFQGKIDGQNFIWNYGLAQFQMTTGIQSITCNDPNDFSRYTVFGLMSDDNQNRVMLYSPLFDIRDNNWSELLFDNEKKNIGTFNQDFSLVITRNGKTVQSSSLTKGELEVLKTQEFTNVFDKTSLRVWLKLKTKLTSCECTNTESALTDGLMVAEFWDYKNFK